MANQTTSEQTVLCTCLQLIARDCVSMGVLGESDYEALVRGCNSSNWQVFLTRDLPQLGKALDAFLAQDNNTEASQEALRLLLAEVGSIFGPSSELFYELNDGLLSPSLIGSLRQIAYLCYKYELPHNKETVQAAVDKFVTTENALSAVSVDVTRDSVLLGQLFREFDPMVISPRHGPGAVSDRSVGGEKYNWTYFPIRLVNVYSHDYFVASWLHYVDYIDYLGSLSDEEPSARLLTVPKDSRGPRIISCEPKEFQWIQQGLSKAMVKWIESHPLTRNAVRFTDQTVNGKYALHGSATRHYVTLDLSEASDRVSLDYVEKVFPDPLRMCLLAARSQSTELPSGMRLHLRKFAPMGSALCFPVLALTVWARLKSAGLDRFHVYGDDVIVTSSDADTAIAALESIGLLVNRSKSCVRGSFRESCGTDAYRGVDVTPIRLHKRWTRRPNATTFVSYVAFANALYIRGYTGAATYIAGVLGSIYGPIPYSEEAWLNVPSFVFPVCNPETIATRVNKDFQLMESYVLVTQSRQRKLRCPGWFKLLHWLSNKGAGSAGGSEADVGSQVQTPVSARTYTPRSSLILKRGWRVIREVGSVSEHISKMAQKAIVELWVQPDSPSEHAWVNKLRLGLLDEGGVEAQLTLLSNDTSTTEATGAKPS